MASRGGTHVSGTDGSDFNHRQKVASHYQISAIYKTRLKTAMLLHFFLFLAMCAKLAEDVLDRLDVFILELEELYIPKPLLWEWVWLASLVFTVPGLTAVRRNRASNMKVYVVGTFLLGLCPVIGAAAYFFRDMYGFVQHGHAVEGVELWQGYPVAVLWYAFLTVAFQAHMFSLYFGVRLILAWQRGTVVKKAK
ncbi:protein jagunal [Dermacentor andersoni]|uniref:protein jagunal n=1 Tax=Dermacentor andersoni TaxID=34620 RepID=UPI00215507B1|nr:protein jagunal-like [Dermacentor andersoni]